METTSASAIHGVIPPPLQRPPIARIGAVSAPAADALPACQQVRQIRLRDVDAADQRYQLRVQTSAEDLVDSLRDHGQQLPVILYGSAPPYRIIDGFRRSEALAKLGSESVLAIVRDDVSDSEAFRLSFINNVQRRNLNSVDKANAIWLALNREGITKQDVATSFAMSLRQVNRYLQLLEFDEAIRAAMAGSRITMAQAIALSRANVRSPEEVIERIERDNLSAPKLARLFRSSARRAQSQQRYIVRQGSCFTLRELRYHPSLPPAEVKQMAQALQQGLEFIHHAEAARIRRPELAAAPAAASIVKT